MTFAPSKEYAFFIFSMGYVHIDIGSQEFYETRKKKNIYYEPVRRYFNDKKKIVEGHIDIDHHFSLISYQYLIEPF